MQGEVDFVESLTTDYSASFVMEQPKLVSYVPSSTLPISETSSIIFSYNFDFPASLLNSVSVTQRTGNLAAVPVQVRLSNSRTLEIKPVSKFHFDTQVTVTVPSVSVDGVVVNGMTVIKDVVGSNTLVVASTTPSSGAIDVGLTSEISVTFSHMLALTPAVYDEKHIECYKSDSTIL